MNKNITIGITGGIGAGKSIISRILRCNGLPVYDCDFEAKSLMKNDLEIKNALINRFGHVVYENNGDINKAFLSKEIFNDSEARYFVNKIVHSAVRKDIMQKRNEIVGYFFIESAIMVTGGVEDLCQSVWIVDSPEQERIRRVEKRDNLKVEEIKKRIKSQKSEIQELKSKDLIIIENDNLHPVLLFVLNKTGKIYNHQILNLSC